MAINHDWLMEERSRLLAIIEEAKAARGKLKVINTLIAMYGETNGKVPSAVIKRVTSLPTHTPRPPRDLVKCGKCGNSYKGITGLAVHNRHVHTGNYKVADDA